MRIGKTAKKPLGPIDLTTLRRLSGYAHSGAAREHGVVVATGSDPPARQNQPNPHLLVEGGLFAMKGGRAGSVPAASTT